MKKLIATVKEALAINRIEKVDRNYARMEATLLTKADRINDEISVYTRAMINALGSKITQKQLLKMIREIQKIVSNELTMREKEAREWEKDFLHW